MTRQRIRPRDDHNVATPRDRLPTSNSGPNPSLPDLHIHQFLPSQMSTAFHLDLILDVESGYPETIVHLDGPGDRVGPTESRVGVCDEWDPRVDVGDHLTGGGEVVEGGKGEVGEAQAGGGGHGAGLVLISASESTIAKSANEEEQHTMHGKPASMASRAEIPSYTPGAWIQPG